MLANSAAILGELQGGTGEHLKPREIASISCPAVCLVGDITVDALRDVRNPARTS